MLSLETLESQISALMEAEVEVAVAELRRLLEQCSAAILPAAARPRAAPPAAGSRVKSGDGDGHAPPAAEERRLFHEAVTVTRLFWKRLVQPTT